MRVATVALLLLCISEVFAADLYKCRDQAGRITYSSSACEKQGLKPAGAIRDRTTVVPSERLTHRPKPPAPATPAPRGDPPGADKPVDPSTR